MAKSKNSNKSLNSKNNIFLVLNLVLAVVTMAFCATLVGSCMANQYKQAAIFLGVIILLQVGFQILLFIIKDRKKDKLRALIVGIIYVCAAIVAFMANE